MTFGDYGGTAGVSRNMPPGRIELPSQAPEACALSVKLRGLLLVLRY